MKRVPCESCGADMIWVLTERARMMPVNADPVLVARGFRLKARVNGEPPLARWAVAKDGERLYVSHFATCPHAPQHRRSR